MSGAVSEAVSEAVETATDAVVAETAAASATVDAQEAQIAAATAEASASQAETAAQGAVAASEVAAALAQGNAAQTLLDAMSRLSAAEIRNEELWTEIQNQQSRLQQMASEISSLTQRVSTSSTPQPEQEAVVEILTTEIEPESGEAVQEALPTRRKIRLL